MDGLREDIAGAYARMAVTFGTRTAVRNLAESLHAGETVIDMVACQFSGSDGVLVLTDERVIAIRDDLAQFRLRSVGLDEIGAVDYAPRIHDGLGVITGEGRIAVRRMHRSDSDRVVDGILLRAPGAVLGATLPGGPGSAPVFQAHPGYTPPGQAAAAPAGPGTAPPADAGAPPAAGTDAAVPSPPGTRRPPTDADLAAGAEADAAVLVGVLADLHAKGILTDAEFAAKVAHLTTRS